MSERKLMSWSKQALTQEVLHLERHVDLLLERVRQLEAERNTHAEREIARLNIEDVDKHDPKSNEKP